jgi:hypothetical protein
MSSLLLLPNRERAFIDVEGKLKGYALNFAHPEGKHKAFVFLSVLNLKSDDAELLKQFILEGIRRFPAHPKKEDQWGQRYTVEFPLSYNEREVIIKTGWIVKVGEDFPRLTSCYIDE